MVQQWTLLFTTSNHLKPRSSCTNICTGKPPVTLLKLWTINELYEYVSRASNRSQILHAAPADPNKPRVVPITFERIIKTLKSTQIILTHKYTSLKPHKVRVRQVKLRHSTGRVVSVRMCCSRSNGFMTTATSCQFSAAAECRKVTYATLTSATSSQEEHCGTSLARHELHIKADTLNKTHPCHVHEAPFKNT